VVENKYRLAEKSWGSIQGEAVYAGTPSVWIRTFGCNLTCPGFPCDTEYAWNKDMRDNSLMFTIKELVDNAGDLLVTDSNPKGLFIHPKTGNPFHLVFSGGEPLLPKYQKMIMEFIKLTQTDEYIDKWYPQRDDDLDWREPLRITIETNGTQKLSEEFKDFIDDVECVEFLFSFSPKLYAASGEKDAVNYENLVNIIADSDYMSHIDFQLKFVCDESDECEQELDETVAKLIQTINEMNNFDIGLLCLSDRLWVMPKGTTREDQLEIAPIVEKYQDKGYKIATRNHTYIWSDAKGR
jgi:organic radical activating enzyme